MTTPKNESEEMKMRQSDFDAIMRKALNKPPLAVKTKTIKTRKKKSKPKR